MPNLQQQKLEKLAKQFKKELDKPSTTVEIREACKTINPKSLTQYLQQQKLEKLAKPARQPLTNTISTTVEIREACKTAVSQLTIHSSTTVEIREACKTCYVNVQFNNLQQQKLEKLAKLVAFVQF